MVLGIRSKSRKSVPVQVHYTIHVQEIKPWPPSQSLRSAQSVVLQWENGDQISGSLASTAGNGRIEFNESFRLSILMLRDASKKGKNRESFQKNCLEFCLYDKTVKSQLLGSATLNFAEVGIIKETKGISILLNCKKSFRNSTQPFLYVKIQPFDIECSSSSPNSNLSKELSQEKEESESVSESPKDEDIGIASFTDDDDDDDVPSNTFQTIRSTSETTRDSTKISDGGRKGSTGLVLPSENTTSSLLRETKGETSTQFNDIKSPSSPTVLCSDMENAANGRPYLSKSSKESIKVADVNSKIGESIQQSSTSYSSSNMKPNFGRSSQSQVTQDDRMKQEDITRDQRFNKGALEKVSSISDARIMKDKEKMNERSTSQEQFTSRNGNLENELTNKFSDDDSRKKGKLSSPTLLNKKSDKHSSPTSILMNDKTEDTTNLGFPFQSGDNYEPFISSPTHNQEEEINALTNVHVNTVCHEVNGNDRFLNDKTELKAEVEMLREELREAAALEASLYSVIAEHSSSSNKVHAPARRLSRFYFHACRAGSPARMASAAQSAVSGFVLVSKACGNDVPRLTFWFSNILLLRAIVSKGVENIHLGDVSFIKSKSDGADNTLHEDEKVNTEKHCRSWEEPETLLFALEKVEAWIFSRIVESVWWQTLTPYMQSAAAKGSNSRKNCDKRYRIGDQDQGNFSIDLWKRAFKDACERLCPLRAGGHECGCLPMIARLVMEQLVSRLDVAMFNAILRESAEEMPTDPISDPISDSKVLPVPAGKSSFGVGAQLKNAIGDWSRWLSALFSIDDGDGSEVSNENEPKHESSFKPFILLNALSDLMMLPMETVADASMRKEVCPRFGISLIKQVVSNFVPDEFSPGPIPEAVIHALNNEDIEEDEGSITSFPCSAGAALYAAPPPSSIVGMIQEVGTQTVLRKGSFVLKKLYASDDELDELDSPFSAIGMDDSSFSSKEKFAAVKGDRKVARYELLREVWKTSDS